MNLLCKFLGHKWTPRDWKLNPPRPGEINDLWMVCCQRCRRLK